MARPRTNRELAVGDIIGDLTVTSFELWRDKGNRLRRRYQVSCICGKKEYRTEYVLIQRKSVRCSDCTYMRTQRSLKFRGVGRVYDAYKDSARQRNIDFKLSRDDVENIILLPCNYCGSEPSNKRLVQTKNGDEYFKYNGIDRADSKIGYVMGNVYPCCAKCNYAKKNLTVEDFLTWVKRVYEFSIKNGESHSDETL